MKATIAFICLSLFAAAAQADRPLGMRWPAAGSRANRVSASAINPYAGRPVHAVGVGTNLTAPNFPVAGRIGPPGAVARPFLKVGVNIVEK